MALKPYDGGFEPLDTTGPAASTGLREFNGDFEPLEPPSGILRRTVGDTGISLLKGAIGVPEAAVGLADIVTGGQAGKAAERIGFRPKEAKSILDDLYSPEQKAANQRVAQAEGFVDTAQAMLANPSTIAHTVAESAPSMLAGGAVGRGVGALTKLPAWALGAVGEGAVGAGQAAESIRQSTDDGLLSAKQSGAALLSGLGTGALAGLGGKAAQKLGISDVDTLLAGGAAQASSKSLPRRVVEGALTEGALQELPQSMQEQAWQNFALDQPLGQGVAEAGAAGLLAGGVMGAGGGVIHARPHSEAAPEAAASSGPLSRAVGQLPAPNIAGALPAPEQTVFVDAAGNANTQGPVRNVDGEMRPEPQARQPWVDPGNGQAFGGPGMEQQVPPGQAPLVGEYQPAAAAPVDQPPAAIRTFDGEVVRPSIADLRQDAFIVDSQGQAEPGATRNQFAYQGPAPRNFGPGMEQSVPRGTEAAPPNQPAAEPARAALPAPDTFVVDGQGNAAQGPVAPFVAPEPQQVLPGGPGMDQQAQSVQRPSLELLLPQVRERLAAGEAIDAAALAEQTGASRALARQAVQGAQLEQQVVSQVFKSVPGANKALRSLPLADQFEVAKTGTRQWQVRAKAAQEVGNADSPAGVADDGARGAGVTAPAQVPDMAEVPAAQPGPAAVPGGQPDSGAGVPAAAPAADGQPAVEGRLDQGVVNGQAVAPVQAPKSQSEAPRADVESAIPASGDVGQRGQDAGPGVVEQGLSEQAERRQTGEPEAVAVGVAADQQNAIGRGARADERIPQAAPTPSSVHPEQTPVQSEAGGKLPDVLSMPKKRYLDRQAKKTGLKKGSPGYEQAVRRLQSQYESEVARASAGLTFEQYNALNSNTPEGVNRQAWDALRRDSAEQMYSRNSSQRAPAAGNGARAGQLSLQLKRLTDGWQNAPEVRVVQSIKDLPETQRRQVERDGAFDVEGIFAGGQVYLVADNLRDVRHAAFVLQHEVLGHAGLQGTYGQRLTPLLMSVYNGNPELKSQADALVQRFGYTPAVAMEEVLADMAAAGTIQQQPFWSRLVTAMRNALRSLGMNLSWSEGDIQALLANARRYVVNGRSRPGVRAAFSRDGRSGRGIELADEQGRLLAPNGKPSKLNQRQWHQARSKSFKQWFGDWQAVVTQKRLDAMTPLKLRTPEAWRAMSEKQKLAAVEAALKLMAREGEVLHHAELGDVQMAMSGAKKASSTAADPAKRVVLSRLREAFEHSIYASSSAGQAAPTASVYHKLLAPIDIDGAPLVAVFTVREDANGRKFYNAVTVNRKSEAPAASPVDMRDNSQESLPAYTGASASAVSPGDMSSEAQRSLPANTEVTSFVRQPLARVNPDSVSKVIDGNGEPLVLYHGTGEQFTVFEQGRAGGSTGHATAPLGIFLTSDAKVASAYAEKATDGMPGLANVMPLFSSIKQPYRMSVAESQAIETPQAAIALRQKLEREGYDGIQFGDTGTWIAFYNTQVKSATANTGTFDEINPDIRYSRASQREALRKLGLAPKEAQKLSDKIEDLLQRDWKALLKDLGRRSEEGLADGLIGIRRAEEAVGVIDPNRQGYVSARLASGLADVMHGVLHYGAPEWRDGVVARKADTRGLLEVLGDLGAGNLNDWLGWLGGKRAEQLKAQGRENNLSDQEIADLVALAKGREQLFERAYRDYAKLNDAVLDLAEGAGLIDPDARKAWANDYYVPFYRETEDSLFSGPRTKRGLSHQTAAIKALKGGEIPTSDLLENILTGWSRRVDASLKNKALLEVVDNLKGSPFLSDESVRYTQAIIPRAELAKRVRKDRKTQQAVAAMLGLKDGVNAMKVASELLKPENEGFEKLWALTAPSDPDIIRVQRGGKNEYYKVNDESLLRGLKSMAGSVFNDPITRIGRAFKRVLTTGVTASPDFILRNFIRDAAHAWVINKDGFKLGRDSIKGLRDAFRQDQDYRNLMFAGASFQGGYVHGTDPEASAQIIRRALAKKGLNRARQDSYLSSLVTSPKQLADILGKGWEHYREVGERVENANRLSTYKAALEAGKSPRQAAFEAKDLMDYSLRGNFAALQWFTDMVPFLNARIQGLYKLGRAAKGDTSLIAKQVAMKGGYLMLFTLALAALNGDDKRYKELQEFDKDTNWHIFLGDQHFRIPKPFELGLIFGTVPERLLHLATGNENGKQFGSAVARGIFDTLAFNPVPQFYQPIRELQANRNFFMGTPIEDMADEGKLPEARYDERTSVLSRAAGQVTGPLFGISPKQLDHLVKGYTGTMGAYALAMGDLVAGAMTAGEMPSSRIGDLPIAKVLYRGDEPRSTRYQAEFYDMMQEADQLYRTMRYYRQEGRVDAAEQLLDGNRAKLRHRPALGLARQQLGALRKQMDAVYRNTEMTGEQKRERLNDLQLRSNQVAERVVKASQADF
ncbi:TPA: LPD38 domain-containing protein [Pseudomonas aeruginosa]